jgi:hypothetical protein
LKYSREKRFTFSAYNVDEYTDECLLIEANFVQRLCLVYGKKNILVVKKIKEEEIIKKGSLLH